MRRFVLCTLVLATAAAAQERMVVVQRAGPTGGGAVPQSEVIVSAVPGARVSAGVEFMSAEMMVDPVVGAPYSAQAVTETTQVLADGNRIQRKMTSAVYRDSEGRTRREQSLSGFGSLAPQPTRQMIFITDPVAGASYMLQPETKTARKTVSPTAAGLRQTLEENRRLFTGSAEALRTETLRREALRAQAVPAEPPRAETMRAALLSPPKRESLGRQWIEGVEVEGTRTVTLIPAGQIGNERPIEIVSERWFSPELKTVVLSRTVDPRTGETVYRLTNISRAEPARSLFEIPPDYNVQ